MTLLFNVSCNILAHHVTILPSVEEQRKLLLRVFICTA